MHNHVGLTPHRTAPGKQLCDLYFRNPLDGCGRERCIQSAGCIARELDRRAETSWHRNCAPRAARGKGHRLWRLEKLCFMPGAAKMICRTSITGTFVTGQVAVRVDIVEREGDLTARLQVFSPVGMY